MSDVRPTALRDGIVRAVATNTLWGTFGRIAGGLFAFLTIALTTRTLGPEGYGGYATILAFLYVFNALADGGFYNLLARDIARPGQDPERLVATAVTLRALALLVTLLSGLALFAFIPRYDGLQAAAPLVALSYAALSLSQLLMVVFQKHLVVQRAALIEVSARAVQLVGVAALFAFGIAQVGAFVGVLAVSSMVQFVATVRGARRYVPVRFGAARAELLRFWRESLPVSVSLIFTLVYFRLDTVLLSLLQDVHAVGIYNLSYKLLEQLIFFPAMFIGILTPLLSETFVRDREKFLAIFARAADLVAAAALPMLVGGWFLAEPLIALLGGGAFSQAEAPLRVLLFATTLIFFGTLLGTAVIVAGRQHRAVAVYALAMTVNLAGNLVFIPRFSFMAAAWTTALTEAFVDAGLVYVLWRSGIPFRVPKFLRIVAATAVMALPLVLFARPAIAVLGTLSLIPFLIACPTLYGAALLWFRAVSPDDLRLLRKRS